MPANDGLLGFFFLRFFPLTTRRTDLSLARIVVFIAREDLRLLNLTSEPLDARWGSRKMLVLAFLVVNRLRRFNRCHRLGRRLLLAKVLSTRKGLRTPSHGTNSKMDSSCSVLGMRN
jgi:hypothetical protein